MHSYVAMAISKTITVAFPGGKAVDCIVDDFVVHTDQSPTHGGAGAAPEPFALFLASIGACAGFYVLAFCQARNISTEGIELTQANEFDPDGRLREINLHLKLPGDFPAMYVGAIRAAAASCKVKKVLASPPNVAVDVSFTPSIHRDVTQ